MRATTKGDDMDKRVEHMQGPLDGVNLLADQFLDIEPPNRTTALHTATEKGLEDTVRLLLQRGVAVDAVDASGLTPLYYAARKGNEAIMRLLLDAGACPNYKDSNNETLLHTAAFLGECSVIELLLENGASVDPRDCSERTPLHYAAMYDREKAAETLLDKGADINAKDKQNATPIYYAFNRNKHKVGALLGSKGADGRLPPLKFFEETIEKGGETFQRIGPLTLIPPRLANEHVAFQPNGLFSPAAYALSLGPKMCVLRKQPNQSDDASSADSLHSTGLFSKPGGSESPSLSSTKDSLAPGGSDTPSPK